MKKTVQEQKQEQGANHSALLLLYHYMTPFKFFLLAWFCCFAFSFFAFKARLLEGG